jgi:hypothetical protein
LPAPWLLLLAGFLLLAILLSLTASRRRRLRWSFAATLLAAGIWVACGGGGGGGGGSTPPPAPVVTLSPFSLLFGQLTMGASSKPQTVALSNTGNASLSISSISITGSNAGDFAQSNSCGATLAAGANCPIKVTFTPTLTGARTASLSVTDNASNSPQNLSLSGTGVAPSTPAGTYTVSVTGASGSDSHSITLNVNVQ